MVRSLELVGRLRDPAIGHSVSRFQPVSAGAERCALGARGVWAVAYVSGYGAGGSALPAKFGSNRGFRPARSGQTSSCPQRPTCETLCTPRAHELRCAVRVRGDGFCRHASPLPVSPLEIDQSQQSRLIFFRLVPLSRLSRGRRGSAPRPDSAARVLAHGVLGRATARKSAGLLTPRDVAGVL
jgi:hypothetical protein